MRLSQRRLSEIDRDSRGEEVDAGWPREIAFDEATDLLCTRQDAGGSFKWNAIYGV